MATSLENRVLELEGYVKVVKVLATIFGASGAFGLGVLAYEGREITKLQDNIQVVEKAREAALQELELKKDASERSLRQVETDALADIHANARPLVKEALNAEMTQQIGNLKKWTDLVYAAAASNPPGSSYWQVRVSEKYQQENQELIK